MKLKLTALALAGALVVAQACQTPAPQVEVAKAPAPTKAAVKAAPTKAKAAPAKVEVAKVEVAKAEVAPTPAPAAAVKPAPAPRQEATEVVEAASATAPAPGLSPRKGDVFRVLILGDSMAATDFGKQLELRLDKHSKVRCDRRGKSATGLARPDFFDWMSEGARRVKKHNPDLVVVVIGGNDGQDLLPKKKGTARRVFWKGNKWAAAYKARLEKFAGLLMADDRRLMWIELPAMDHRSLEKKLKIIREVQKDTVAGLGDNATYLSTRDYFYKGDKLLRAARVKGYKKPQTLRQDDGIHFTVPGSRFFADRVYPKVLRALELSDG